MAMSSELPRRFRFTRDVWNQSVLASMLTTTIILIFLSNLASALLRAWARRRLTNSLHALQAVAGVLVFCLLLVQLYIPKECNVVIGVYMMGSYLGTACLDGVLLLKAYYANRCWHPILAVGTVLETFRLVAFVFTTATNEVTLSPWGTCITASISSAALFVRVCADVIQNIFLSLCFISPILRQSKLWMDTRRAADHANGPPDNTAAAAALAASNVQAGRSRISALHADRPSSRLPTIMSPITGAPGRSGPSRRLDVSLARFNRHGHGNAEGGASCSGSKMSTADTYAVDDADTIYLCADNNSHSSLVPCHRPGTSNGGRRDRHSTARDASHLADRTMVADPVSRYSAAASHRCLQAHAAPASRLHASGNGQPSRIYDQLVQDGAFYAFFVNVANLYCTAVVYWTLWGDLSSLAFIITWPLGSQLIHLQLNRARQRRKRAQQRSTRIAPWHQPGSHTATPNPHTAPVMTSTMIYDTSDYLHNDVLPRPLTAKQWSGMQGHGRFSLSSSLSSSSSLFSVMASPISIVAYSLPSLQLDTADASPPRRWSGSHANQGEACSDTEPRGQHLRHSGAPVDCGIFEGDMDALADGRVPDMHLTCEPLPAASSGHRQVSSPQASVYTRSSSRKRGDIAYAECAALSMRSSQSSSANLLAGRAPTRSPSQSPVRMMFPSLFSVAIGMAVQSSMVSDAAGRRPVVKCRLRASSPSSSMMQSPRAIVRHASTASHDAMGHATERYSSSSL